MGDKTSRKSQMPHKVIAICITAVASVLIVLHLLCPALGIDGVTIGLLVVAALPWFLPFLKSVELPGGLKIELREAKAATEKITTEPIEAKLEATLEPVTASIEGTTTSLDPISNLKNIAEQDPNLALVGFRIELEKKLRQIADSKAIGTSKMSLSRLINELIAQNVLPNKVAAGVMDLVALGNSAAHGVEVSRAASDWVLNVGPAILLQLDALSALTKPQ